MRCFVVVVVSIEMNCGEFNQSGARWNGVYDRRYPGSMSLISLDARKLAS
jgi:hypothetical protein